MTEDLQRGTRSHRRRRATTATAAALTLLLLAGACRSDEDEGAAPDVSTSTTAADAVTSCPTEVDEADFMAAAETHDLLAAFIEPGPLSPRRQQPAHSLTSPCMLPAEVTRKRPVVGHEELVN